MSMFDFKHCVYAMKNIPGESNDHKMYFLIDQL